MREISKVADPYLEIYPKNSAEDYFARSIWDMCVYEDAIYIGSGDMWNNRGPVMIKSFIQKNDEIMITDEIVLNEEMLNVFRVCEDRLLIPGYDPTGHKNFGSYYMKRSGSWGTRPTIPNATHVNDIALFENNIIISYSVGGKMITKISSDDGQTWDDMIPGLSNQPVGTALLPINNRLLILGYDYFHVYKAGTFQTLLLNEIILINSNRLVTFNNGLLCAPVALYTLGLNDPSLAEQIPLYFMEDYLQGPKRVQEFNKKGIFVRDLVIYEKNCYIMYVKDFNGVNYKTVIKRSRNLDDWELIAEFLVPALPYSFEILNNEVYIGLGNGWYDIKRPEAGTIWKIDEKTHL